MPGIGVVVNPHARAQPARAGPGATVRRRRWQGRHACAQTGSLDRGRTLAREFRERRIDVLAVCGGDGSFFRTLSAMVRAYGSEPLPQFLPLRAGSMNTIARSIGCRRGSPERMLAEMVADYRAGRPFEVTERHLIQVNGEHFGFMVGAGVVVDFLQVYYASGAPGRWTAASCLAASSSRADAFGAVARLVAAGCGRHRLRRRARPAPALHVHLRQHHHRHRPRLQGDLPGDRKRGFFHLLAGPILPRHVLPRLWRLWRGRPLELDELYDDLAQHVRVEFSRPTHYMIDGDVLGVVPRLDVVTGPRLTIIQK